MTKKETIEIQILLSAIRSAISDIEWYCQDFDSDTLKSTAENLRESLKNFRETVKI